MVVRRHARNFNLASDNMVSYKQLLQAGVHFGHLTRKWHPSMAPYIFMEHNGIHILNVKKTERCLSSACAFLSNLAENGKTILFVGTKAQAKDIIYKEAMRLRVPYVIERWLGGMLTNFVTISRAVRRMQSMENMVRDAAYKNFSKRERLMWERERQKKEVVFRGVSEMRRLPDALFIVDSHFEHIALQEAVRLNIPVVAIVDTNSDPSNVDYPIPANDDSTKAISLIVLSLSKAIEEGIARRKERSKADKEASKETSKESSSTKKEEEGRKEGEKGEEG